eukprot:TRINITY_DN6322_c0_g1_i5.p1 TRINITY_DN6322_c0_g1~~TRINITY_DN6322_c0_g1_i5.p1  ORF type:complete len:403 (-),score=49.34 TRINITY_DN6322_c0_g1_i5:244-1452(-)
MRLLELAVPCIACLSALCSSEIPSDGGRCAENEDAVLLQMDLMVSWPSPIESVAAHNSGAHPTKSQHHSRVLSFLEKANAGSVTLLEAVNSRSQSNTWVILLVLASMIILLPVVVVSCTEISSSKHAAASELLRDSSKAPAAMISAPPSARDLPLKPSTPLRTPDELSRAGQDVNMPPTAKHPPDANPPPICPSLILPTNEARFRISLKNLTAAAQGVLSAIDILGMSGQKLLHGSIEEIPEAGLRLAISSVGCEADPRATIVAGKSYSHEVYGRGGQPYGTLEFVGARVLLMQAGDPVMAIDCGNDNELQYTASRMDGRVLASAGRHPTPLSDGSHFWRIQVRPGTDAILVMISVMAIMVLPRPMAAGSITPSLPGTTPRQSRGSIISVASKTAPVAIQER